MTISPPPAPYFQVRTPRIVPHAAGEGPWSVPNICAAYGWPRSLAGGGVIAIVELGGGWTKADMAAYFSSIGQPEPTIIDVSVDGTKNVPGGDADGEVALDIELAAAGYFCATGHPARIRVYWASDIAAAVRAATKDSVDVISISWGADEANWDADSAADMELAAQEATAAGIMVFAASGDNDSSDGGPTPANVDLPAACPHVIGCGGTSKTQTTEKVWNNNPGKTSGEGTGGGFSTRFPAQAWQHGAPPPPPGLGRMVPDISANADPDTGYEIIVGGQAQVVGGTSAVAPLYAGLFAAFGTKLGLHFGVSGAMGPTLWANPKEFVDITSGDNGAYKALVGPDACTGLGAPNATALAVFAEVPVAEPTPAPVPTPVPAPAPIPAPPAPPANGPTLAEAQHAIAQAFVHAPIAVTRADAVKRANDALAAFWASKKS